MIICTIFAIISLRKYIALVPRRKGKAMLDLDSQFAALFLSLPTEQRQDVIALLSSLIGEEKLSLPSDSDEASPTNP